MNPSIERRVPRLETLRLDRMSSYPHEQTKGLPQAALSGLVVWAFKGRGKESHWLDLQGSAWSSEPNIREIHDGEGLVSTLYGVRNRPTGSLYPYFARYCWFDLHRVFELEGVYECALRIICAASTIHAATYASDGRDTPPPVWPRKGMGMGFRWPADSWKGPFICNIPVSWFASSFCAVNEIFWMWLIKD